MDRAMRVAILLGLTVLGVFLPYDLLIPLYLSYWVLPLYLSYWVLQPYSPRQAVTMTGPRLRQGF